MRWMVHLLFCAAISSSALEQKLFIDRDSGFNNESCLTPNEGNYPCKTLDYAFRYKDSSTTYVLVSNYYNITKQVSFTHLTGLMLVGNNTEVHCVGDEVGIAFINVSNVTLDGITFRYCAATQNCTSKQFTDEHSKPWCTFKVGLYFNRCENVNLSQITVADGANAVGVVMYDTGGTNKIVNSHFANNSVNGSNKGGGGFYLEFTYCSPGSINCTNNADKESYSITNSNYIFDSVVFENNKASNEGLGSNSSYIIPYKANHQSFGRGGGLCMYIKGQARISTISLKNCTFVNNTAQWGAGVMLEFHDNATNNSVSFNDCIFEGNSCYLKNDDGTGGGGMRLGHYVYALDKKFGSLYGNNILYSGGYFNHNYAIYGGGLSISAGLEAFNVFGIHTLINISGVIFNANIAKFGSAVHISHFPFSSRGIMPDIFLANVKFINNSANYFKLIGDPSKPHVEGIGTLYINQVDIKFVGSVLFADNRGTGLAVAGSVLDLTETDISFERNSGYRGGAMALLGCAHILISDDTNMKFDSNTAMVEGGAMYIRYVEMDNSKTFFNCFIRHSNPYLDPNDWQTNVTFINNRDKNGSNAIHSTSIYPCGWAGGTAYTVDKKYIFCWTNWNYYNVNNSLVNCSSEITSDAGKVTFNHNDETELLEVIPGHEFQLPLQVVDDHGNNLTDTTVFSTSVNDSRVKVAGYFWGGSASVAGNRSEIGGIALSLESLSDVIWRAEIKVRLQRCPPGLKGDECSCSGSYGGILNCDPHSSNVTMRVQYWIGLVNDSYLVGLCPPGFCKQTKNSSVVLPNNSNATQLEETVCERYRTNVLCGMCLDGYGPSVNSQFDCVACNMSSYVNIIRYIASIYIPLIFFSIVLIVFDIRLTTGPVNAFILYSQMVTTTFTLDAYDQIPYEQISHLKYNLLKRFLFVPYGIFNLEFAENLFPPFCLSPNSTALSVIVLEYAVASFPLIMIIVATVCLNLKECFCTFCSRLSVKVVKRARCCKKINFTQALLPAFASFLMLSYHKFSLTSVYLLSSQSLFEENDKMVHPYRVYFAGHLNTSDPYYVQTYFIPSVLVLIFLFVFPIFLLGYPLTLLEMCLSKLKPIWKFYPAAKIHFFLDTFHGCYKMKLGFFSGLYFFFRLSVNITYLSVQHWIVQFVVQQIVCVIMGVIIAIVQPYREKYLNYVDSLIFANLGILNTLSLYMYFTYQNGQNLSFKVFAFQYFLMSLPLLYVTGFVIYYIWKKKFQNNMKLKELKFIIRRKSVITANHDRGWLTQESDEQLFARAENSVQNPSTNQTTKSNTGHSHKDSTSSITPLRSSTSTAYGTMTSVSSGASNGSSE